MTFASSGARFHRTLRPVTRVCLDRPPSYGLECLIAFFALVQAGVGVSEFTLDLVFQYKIRLV